MIPSDAINKRVRGKTKPARTGTFHTSESTTVLPKTIPLSNNETIAADKIADANHIAGEQGLVNTIFRLRLRRCEEIMNSPRPPARKSRNTFRMEKICCRALKLCTPELLKRAGRELNPVNNRNASANAMSKRLRR